MDIYEKLTLFPSKLNLFLGTNSYKLLNLTKE